METVSIRLSPEEIKKIQALSKKERKGKSAIVRELIQEGLIYKALQEYRAGRKSLATLAKDLRMPLSAVLDLLADLGIEAPLTYEDYLEGLETLRQLE